jgi:hypothetical protein
MVMVRFSGTHERQREQAKFDPGIKFAYLGLVVVYVE